MTNESQLQAVEAHAAVRVYKTQRAAVEFLKNSGWKIEKSKFNSDVKTGKVSRNAEGHYEEVSLLAYAPVHLQPLSSVEDRAANEATLQRLTAEADLKAIMAKRQRILLEKDQGKFIPKSEYEAALAARAQFFKNSLENFCYDVAADLIMAAGGNESNLEKVQRFLLKKVADMLDAYAEDREFVLDLEERG